MRGALNRTEQWQVSDKLTSVFLFVKANKPYKCLAFTTRKKAKITQTHEIKLSLTHCKGHHMFLMTIFFSV